MQMLNKMKTKIGETLSPIFTKSQKIQTEDTLQKDSNEYFSFTIDEVQFSSNTLASRKERQNMINKLIKTYSDSYVNKLGLGRLELQIVGPMYFLFVKSTNQTKFNHSGSQEGLISRKNQLIDQIYSNPQNLRHFWSIDFLRLKVLNLSRQNLNSIEGITFMKIPNLECLQLHTNNITSIDCLARTSLPKLKIITLYNNKINAAEKLVRANTPKLTDFEFDNHQMKQNVKIECIDFLSKLQSSHALSKIFIQDLERIISNKKLVIIQKLSVKRIRIEPPPRPIQTKRINARIDRHSNYKD